MKPIFRHSLLVLSLLGLSACSTLGVNDNPISHESDDPLEDFNRSVYAFNDRVDKLILRPVAKSYSVVLPSPAQKGVRNFFGNLGEPINALNNLLQGKVDRALVSTYRFAINSTVGVLGLVDVASKYEVAPAREDFGQTLAVWGVAPGPYIMLPFLGPTSLRHGVGRITDNFILNPINEVTDSSSGRLWLRASDLVDQRASFLGSDEVLDGQLDPYGFLKQAYQQGRINIIYDGTPPETEEEDFDF
jgi:phospholipid-binding lipoprotein MlaA